MSYPIADLASVLVSIGETLDLRAVLTERYGVTLEPKGERWCGVCPLPSTVENFAGSCAEQDASERSIDQPTNLWVSVGERTLVWRCHSCDRHGDVVDLIGYADGVERRNKQVGLGAVRRAAELSGLAWMMDGYAGPRPGRDIVSLDLALAEPVAVALRSATPVDVDRARGLNEYVRKIWVRNLHADDPAAAAARALLVSRGVPIDQARRHGIGFARRGSQIADRLLALAGNPIELALTIGLVNFRVNDDGSREYYDMQRDRLVFPYVEITDDGSRRITGFAGRAREDGVTPKWLNSASVAGLWSKKSALLGLLSAVRLAASTSGRRRCVVSEGGLDALAWERAEIPAVSPVGVDFTVQHATVLQRHGFVSVTVCFDGDEGGRKATPSAVAALLAAGYEYDDVHVIDLADGLDPDDLSIDAMERAYDCPMSPAEFIAAHFDFFREHVERVLPLLSYVPVAVRDELAELLGIDLARVRERPSLDADATPGQRIVRAILAHASACAFLAADDAHTLLSSEPHLLALLRAVPFGVQTDEARLPKTLLRELARARLAQARLANDAGASLDLWRYGQTIEDYRRAWAEREALLDRVRVCEKDFVRLDALVR